MDFLSHPITNPQLIWGAVILALVWVAGIVGAYVVGFADGMKQAEKEFYHGDD